MPTLAQQFANRHAPKRKRGRPPGSKNKTKRHRVETLIAPSTVANNDPVAHPKHYTSHPSGIECIEVTEHMGFCIGNVVKYLWRADTKGAPIEDLRKARWYLTREITRREKEEKNV